MRWWARWRRRKQWRERDLDREIRAHLDLEAEEQAAAGVLPGEASYAARRAFGNVDLFKEATREIWGWAWRDRLAQDIRYGLRRLRKSPGFTTVAVLSLALGVGANTAIFSIIHAVLLRPLPYPEPHRLLAIEETQSGTKVFSSEAMPVSALHFVTWRKQCRSFEQIALLDGLSLNLTGMGEPERLDVERASATLFPLLGVQPRLGRSFLEEEDQPGRDRVVMLSDSLWHRRFQSDPGVVGRKITLDGVPFEVVGVLPASFRTPWLGGPVDLWKPFAIREDELQVIGDFNYECLARLRRGVSREQAVAEMKVIQSGIARTIPERVELGALLTPLAERMTAGSRQGLLLLLAAVGAVLLIACVNITNLLLARNTARRELAIRAAIGASRGRLGHQMLTESLILSALGGMAGVLLAQTVVGLVVAHAPADLPRIDEVRLDAPVFWFSFVISMVAGLVFGFLPAWKFSLADPQDALKADSRTTTGGTSSGRVRRLLVGCEVGLGTVCLVLAGLLMQSFGPSGRCRSRPGLLRRERSRLRHRLPASGWGEVCGRSVERSGSWRPSRRCPPTPARSP
jgi:predicted permease